MRNAELAEKSEQALYTLKHTLKILVVLQRDGVQMEVAGEQKPDNIYMYKVVYVI